MTNVLQMIMLLDYELFGNGVGDVRSTVVESTSRILNVCNRHGAKWTIICVSPKHRKLSQAQNQGVLRMDHDPAKSMDSQVNFALSCGDDVPLHIRRWP